MSRRLVLLSLLVALLAALCSGHQETCRIRHVGSGLSLQAYGHSAVLSKYYAHPSFQWKVGQDYKGAKGFANVGSREFLTAFIAPNGQAGVYLAPFAADQQTQTWNYRPDGLIRSELDPDYGLRVPPQADRYEMVPLLLERGATCEFIFDPLSESGEPISLGIKQSYQALSDSLSPVI